MDSYLSDHLLVDLRYINLSHHTPVEGSKWRLRREVRVSLFRLGPFNAYSSLTARTTLGLVALNYAWFATDPTTMSQPISLGITVLLALVDEAFFANSSNPAVCKGPGPHYLQGAS